jgi:two-component system, OmpR family, alkaline phosphatase synthesis response regulator PhoP
VTRRVLVADDELPIASVVAVKLRNAGLEVTVARDGQDAYEKALAVRPDFIVTDLQMPCMNGLELIARLTAEIGGIPTILLTAKGFEVSRAALAGLPIMRVMTKPFSPRELLSTVQKALGEPVGQTSV